MFLAPRLHSCLSFLNPPTRSRMVPLWCLPLGMTASWKCPLCHSTASWVASPWSPACSRHPIYCLDCSQKTVSHDSDWSSSCPPASTPQTHPFPPKFKSSSLFLERQDLTKMSNKVFTQALQPLWSPCPYFQLLLPCGRVFAQDNPWAWKVPSSPSHPNNFSCVISLGDVIELARLGQFLYV